MLAAIILVILISMSMVLLRVVLGSSIFDRMLGINSFTTHVVVFVAMLSLFEETGYYIDIAIIYGLISFVSIVAFLMYFKYKSMD